MERWECLQYVLVMCSLALISVSKWFQCLDFSWYCFFFVGGKISEFPWTRWFRYIYIYTQYTHIIYTYYTSPPLFFFSWFLITTTLHQLFKFYLTKQKHLNLRRFWEVEAKTRGSVSTAVFRDDEPLKLGSVKELWSVRVGFFCWWFRKPVNSHTQHLYETVCKSWEKRPSPQLVSFPDFWTINSWGSPKSLLFKVFGGPFTPILTRYDWKTRVLKKTGITPKKRAGARTDSAKGWPLNFWRLGIIW